MPTKRERVQVSLPEVLATWVKEEAQKSGLPKSSVILHAIMRAKEQQEAMTFTGRKG